MRSDHYVHGALADTTPTRSSTVGRAGKCENPPHLPDQAAGLRKLFARSRARVIGVLGACEGQGATSLASNLAAVFARCGKTVLLLDENRAPDNLAQMLGLRARYDLLHALRGDMSWHDVLLRDDGGSALLPLARVLEEFSQLTAGERVRLRDSLLAAAAGCDVVLVDAAREGHSLCASLSADEPLLLVLNPTPGAITQTYALLKRRMLHGQQANYAVVVNRVGSEREALTVFDNLAAVARRHLQVRPRRGGAEPSGAGAGASHLLPQTADFVGNVSEVRLDYLGYIPVDEKLKRATQLRRPVVQAFPAAAAAMAMREIAQGVLEAPEPGILYAGHIMDVPARQLVLT